MQVCAPTFRRGLRLVFLLIVSLAAAGCVSWSKHGVIPEPGRKLRVALLPVELGVTIKHLKYIQTTPSGGQPAGGEPELIEKEMRGVTNALSAAMETRLGGSQYLEVIPQNEFSLSLEKAGLSLSTAPLSAQQIRALCAASRADALLKVKLSGYGAIKHKWLVLLVGSGMVEGVTQGIVAYSLVHKQWVAIVIGAEEIAQELVTWGGGAYIFNKIFNPVILEAELHGAVDGEKIWSKTIFVTRDKAAIKKLPKEQQDKREIRLRLTTDKAIGELAGALDKKIKKNTK